MCGLRALVRMLGIVALVVLACSGCAADRPMTIRVLSYNIHHGEGMDERVDLERIARLIRETNADLVALQEVDRGVRRTNQVDEPARLAELTGMTAVFERNIIFQGGDYGNAVLSRLPIERHQNHYLPQSQPDEQRGALEVHVRAGNRKLVFFATHLDYRENDAERILSIELFEKLLTPLREMPVIMAGDFNARPDSRVMVRARTILVDAFDVGTGPGFTFPASEPDRRIDYIMHNGHLDLRCVEFRVIPEPVASDHRPILAVFELGKAPR